MGIIDNVREIADLVKKAGDIELYRKIVKLEGEVIELTREKRVLEEQIQQLQLQLEMAKKLTFRAPFYYAPPDEVPFCPRCWETDKKAIHLTGPLQVIAGTRYDCPECRRNHISDRHEPKYPGPAVV
jgi:hypothetical protein